MALTTILGVAPKGFIGTELLFVPEIWVPMSMEAQIEPGNDWLNNSHDWNIWVLGRIKPGVSRHQAQSEIESIAAQLVREHPDANDGMRVHFTTPGLLGDFFRGPVIAFASVIMGVAGLVLLIACTNLASSLLARATDRRRETAIRLALGAGRIRLVRQLLTENLIIALGGGAGGLLLAWWLTSLITTASLPFDFPFNKTLTIDVRVLVFAFLASLLTVLVFGACTRDSGHTVGSCPSAQERIMVSALAPLGNTRRVGHRSNRTLGCIAGWISPCRTQLAKCSHGERRL